MTLVLQSPWTESCTDCSKMIYKSWHLF